MLSSTLKLFRPRMPAPLVGLDIGISDMQLVELGQDAQGAWILERFADEPLQSHWMADGHIEAPDAVSHALQRLLQKSGTRANRVAIALPANSVITRRIVLPSHLSAQEIEIQIEAEASQFLSFPVEEMRLDFHILGPHGPNSGDVDVLWVATRKERLQERHDLAVQAGLTPVIVDVESYAATLAASRWVANLPNAAQNELIALIQLQTHSFNLQVVRNGEVVYDLEQGDVGTSPALVTDQAGAGNDAFSRFDPEDIACFFTPKHGSPVTVLHSCASLAQDVVRALQFFFSSTSYRHIERIAVFGNTACWDSVVHALQEQARLPVTVLNPFEGMHIAPRLQRSLTRKEAPKYLTACGLAMRRYLS